MEPRDNIGSQLASVLAHRLRAEMRRRKITQEDLAELIGVNPVTLSRWMNGHAAPDDANLKRISELLTPRVSVAVLRREVSSPVTPSALLSSDSEGGVVRDFQALLWSFERLTPKGREAVIDYAQQLRQHERAEVEAVSAQGAPVDDDQDDDATP